MKNVENMQVVSWKNTKPTPSIGDVVRFKIDSYSDYIDWRSGEGLDDTSFSIRDAQGEGTLEEFTLDKDAWHKAGNIDWCFPHDRLDEFFEVVASTDRESSLKFSWQKYMEPPPVGTKVRVIADEAALRYIGVTAFLSSSAETVITAIEEHVIEVHSNKEPQFTCCVPKLDWNKYLEPILEQSATSSLLKLSDTPSADFTDTQGYYDSLDVAPDEAVQHSPTVRKEKEDAVKYKYDRGDDENFFEKGLHQPTTDNANTSRPITPYGSLVLTGEQENGTDNSESQNTQNVQTPVTQPSAPKSIPHQDDTAASQGNEETNDIVYPTVEGIIADHDEILEEHPGTQGLFAETKVKLEAAIGRMETNCFGKELFPSLAEKAAILAHSIITMHPFQDANKRTAYYSIVMFLHENGVSLPDSDDLADIIIAVADGRMNYDHILTFIEEHAQDLMSKHHRQLKRLSYLKLSWKITELKEGQRVRVMASVDTLRKRYPDADPMLLKTVGRIGTVVATMRDENYVDVDFGDSWLWACPKENWQEYLEVVS
jgi:death-on-curing protein